MVDWMGGTSSGGISIYYILGSGSKQTADAELTGVVFVCLNHRITFEIKLLLV